MPALSKDTHLDIPAGSGTVGEGIFVAISYHHTNVFSSLGMGREQIWSWWLTACNMDLFPPEHLVVMQHTHFAAAWCLSGGAP
jgi:hypothetical protein